MSHSPQTSRIQPCCKDKFLREKPACEGVDVVLSEPIVYKHDYFHVGWSWLCVTWNGNASEMQVPQTPLEVHLWILATLPMIYTVSSLTYVVFFLVGTINFLWFVISFFKANVNSDSHDKIALWPWGTCTRFLWKYANTIGQFFHSKYS